MKRSPSAIVLVATVVLACGDGSGTNSPTTPPARTGWDAVGLASAEQLAAKVRASGRACEQYEPWNYEAIAGDYQDKLPLPAAMSACKSDGGEDLTFEVFANQAATEAFVAAKHALLCRSSARSNVAYPGFPFVDGGTWLVEPDDKATADTLAPILGGTARQRPCRD